MSKNYEIRHIELGDHFSVTDLPEGVVRLDADDPSTYDIMPPERVALWVVASLESRTLKPVENTLGVDGLYIHSCDTPVEDPKLGTVLARRDHLFIVEKTTRGKNIEMRRKHHENTRRHILKEIISRI